MEIFFATNNEHKRQEVQQIFTNHKIVIPKDKGITFAPVENGTTFYENSLIKASSLFNIVNTPVLADDSGLCVDILDGKPGIFSSRYAGKDFPKGNNQVELSSAEKNKLLIEHINQTIIEKKLNSSLPSIRSARFVCSLVLFFGNQKIYSVQETLEGQIISSIEQSSGTGGFGYDPIFFLPERNKTVAELSESEKNEISHRGKACAILNRMLV